MRIEQTSLRVNRMLNPFIDTQPFFTWKLSLDDLEEQQSCLVEIFRKDGSSVWNSGWNNSERNTLTAPPECNLEPCTAYNWRVNVIGCKGGTDFAQGSFSTAKRDTPWNGIWITGSNDYYGNCNRPNDIKQALYLRRSFSAEKPERAILYIAGLGYFEATVNGTRTGDDCFSTAYTAFDKRILYSAYDVTDLITEGENTIGVVLGNGFYNCFTEDPWQTSTAPWRSIPKMLCELHLEYKNKRQIIASDSDWRSLSGPIVFNGIRHGETYDARMEIPGWNLSGYKGVTFPAPQALDPGAILQVMEMEPIRVKHKYPAIRRWKSGETWMYEIAQDVTGIGNITFRGPRGTTYTVRYSDRLNEDGSLDQASLAVFIKNYCFQTDQYTKKSDAPETWHATFAFYGIKYIEITGTDTPLEMEDVEVWAIYNDFEDRGIFKTNDPVVNGIQHMARSSVKACSLNTMASDTVREKSSWTGDTGLTSEHMLYNFGAEQFFIKWLQDLRDSQRPGGSMPCIIPSPGWGYNSITGPDWCNPIYAVPWDIYMATGDIRILSDNYDALLHHCSYMRAMAVDEIVNYGLGDWCAPFEGPSLYVNMTKFKCPVPLSDTAFRYAAVSAAERWAQLLGKSEDEKELHQEALSIKESFRRHFYNKKTNRVAGDCQSSTAMMIYYGFAEEDEIPALMQRLSELIDINNGHLDFGILGMKSVFNVMGRYGLTAKCLSMITAPGYPSYRDWYDQGATTLWECWNGNGSHCHHMFSDVSAFFYKYIGGIIPTEPGYRHILIKPDLECGLDWVECRIQSVLGPVECSYRKSENNAKLHIIVPHGASATLMLPGRDNQELSPGIYDIIL